MKNVKNGFKFKMATESKIDAKICFRHSVNRISSFSKRFFVFFLFRYCYAFIEINFFKNSEWRQNPRWRPKYVFGIEIPQNTYLLANISDFSPKKPKKKDKKNPKYLDRCLPLPVE
jgi:hypothetical protein